MSRVAPSRSRNRMARPFGGSCSTTSRVKLKRSGTFQSDTVRDDRTVLRSSLLSDALDRAGRRHQCLGPDLVPLSGSRLEGRAFPFLLERVDAPADRPYRGLLAALDAVPAGSVVVLPGRRAAD